MHEAHISLYTGRGELRGSEGHIAVALYGSTHPESGFLDVLEERKHLGMVSTYLTPEQAVQFAGALLDAARRVQERLAGRDES